MYRWILLTLVVLLAGCTRSAVPIDFQTSTPSPTETSTAAPEEPREFANPNEGHFAIVWVEEGERLPLRVSAGIAAATALELPFDQRGIVPTGIATSLGSSNWVEVQVPADQIGWLPAWNLTEQVGAETFCQDPAVDQQLQALAQSLRQQDGALLASVVSPKRGLIIKHDLTNPEVRIEAEQVTDLFEDRTQYSWGSRFASQTAIQGTFREVIEPSLLEVFEQGSKQACNELQMGQNAPEVKWPGRYQNLNFVSLYRPSSPEGNEFDWRTWVFAIEYVDGQPYLALVVQIRPQV